VDVPRQIFEKTNSTSIAAFFFDLLDAAEPEQRLSPGFLLMQSVRDIPFNIFVQVVTKLFVELSLCLAPSEERP
jgi:hypothetical protein